MNPTLGSRWLAMGMLTGLMLCLSSSVLGGGKSDKEVKVTAKASKLDASGKQVITLTLDINKGWYIYANPVDNDNFNLSQTVVNIKSKVQPASVKIAYPAGKIKEDKSFGKFKIYQDRVEISATIQRAQGDTSPLEVSVRISACDKSTCLLPATVKLTVP